MSKHKTYEFERRQIMTEVMTNHPVSANPWDWDEAFTAAQVAVIPTEADVKVRDAAIERSTNFLNKFGCLVTRLSPTGETLYLHNRSPVKHADGLKICEHANCIFHVGGKKNIIPTPCPDEMAAVREKGASTSVTRSDGEQLMLF